MQAGEVVFNKYEIIHKIKESEEVSVYKAKHIYLNSSWIIKKIHKNHPIYTNEIHMLKALNHESIPLITDVFKENNATYIIREYIEGDTLGEYISREGVMTEEKTVEIAIEICQALEYLHTGFEMPLIYRDIKPDNIVISKNHRIKLIDFGIARFYQKDKDADTEYLGTRGFAAPEQYGMGQTDVRTDIFGVGILMYYMLTKKNLDSVSCQLEPIRFFRNDIQEVVEKIIHKACQFNRDQRYNSITEVKDALYNVKKSMEKISVDYLLNAYKNKLIIVSGIKQGCGATHVVSTLAHYLKRRNKQCLIVDLSDNQALSSLEFTEQAVTNNGILLWNDILLIDNKIQNNIPNEMIDNYLHQSDWIILDYGSKKNRHSEQIYGDYNILVSGIAAWEMSQLEDYLMEDMALNTTLFVNHGGHEQVEKLDRSIHRIYVYKYPYDHTYSDDEKIYDVFYEGVFKDWGMDIKCLKEVKAETFLNIDKFKTKFLKSIK